MTNIFTDPRDGNAYKTVEISNQIWLAENLRYRGPIKKFNNWTIEEKNFYYPPNGDWKNIKQYGCLYTWDNAIKACPDGWHLPSKKEFETPLTNIGSNDSIRWQNLRASTWNNGTNKDGFVAFPTGLYYPGRYINFGSFAYFWSASEYEDNTVAAYFLSLDNSLAKVLHYNKNCAFSVRCIKD